MKIPKPTLFVFTLFFFLLLAWVWFYVQNKTLTKKYEQAHFSCSLRSEHKLALSFVSQQSNWKKRREGESPVWLRRESKVSFCFYFYNFFFFAGKLEVWALVFALGLVWKSGSGNSHKWKSIHGAFQPWTQTEEAICNTYCLIICLRFYHTWCPFSL